MIEDATSAEVSAETTASSENGGKKDGRTIALIVVAALAAILSIAAIVLALTGGASAAEGIDPELVGTVWYWTELGGSNADLAVDDPSRYAVEFTSDGTVHVQADCNQGSGTYTASDGSITIEVLAMTMAMCEPDSLSDSFVAGLNSASAYRIEDGTLSIDLASSGGTMKFSESPPEETPQVDPALVGKVWQWYEFVSPVDTLVVEDPSRYTVEFNADGTVHIQADCNSANGAYSASDGAIQIEALAMTMAMCPPDSHSDDFVRALNAAAVYSFDGDTLRLDLPVDSGTMKLAEDPPPPAPIVDPALIGKVWKWYEFVDPVGKTVVDYPDSYAVEFNADGTVNILADCNRANGTYSASGGSINIEALAMTRALCPPDSYSDNFVRALNAVAVYSFHGDTLLLDLPADRGTLKLSEQPPQPPTPTPTSTPTPFPPTPEPTATLTPAPETDPDLVGKVWQWYQFVGPTGEVVVNDPASYTVLFALDGSVRVKADCNAGSGAYTAGGGSIDISVLAMTLAACPPDSLGDEFVQGLNTAAIYSFDGDTLLLDLPMDSGTMMLAESPPVPPGVDPDLTGTIWQWVEFTSPTGQPAADDPSRYAVEFKRDGTVAILADCNRAGGTYTADAGAISITLGPTTLAACPPESLSSEFLGMLDAAAIYFFRNGDLFMDLKADAGTMKFAVGP